MLLLWRRLDSGSFLTDLTLALLLAGISEALRWCCYLLCLAGVSVLVKLSADWGWVLAGLLGIFFLGDLDLLAVAFCSFSALGALPMSLN